MDETNVDLRKKDERYIEKKIALIRKELLEGNNTTSEHKPYLIINADGKDPLSPEAVESVIAALSFDVRQATIINRK